MDWPYIKLPSFNKDITSVTVTLGKISTSGASIFLSSTKDATSGDLTSLTASSDLVYSFNLSGKGIKTAYLRCYGSTMYVESIEVVVGEDTRKKLSSPVVVAGLNKDNEAITNSIDVIWEPVENASSYVVTATPAEGAAVSNTVTADESETYTYTITGLAYETEYTISVVAKPSDTESYKDSEPGVYSETVKTGTKPATGVETKTETIDFESASTAYTFWTFTNMTSKQTGSITAHGGTNYGTTGGKTTASIVTKKAIKSPNNISFYISKTTTNGTSTSWKIQVSTDNKNWNDVKTQEAATMSKGEWVEVTQDLSSYSNIYIRVYYAGGSSTAVRAIDDLTLTYAE